VKSLDIANGNLDGGLHIIAHSLLGCDKLFVLHLERWEAYAINLLGKR
jgi:hypothetical protein